MTASARSVLLACALVGLATTGGGCAMANIMDAVSPARVEPEYELADRPTVVFVEVDGAGAGILNDPTLVALMAARATHDLRIEAELTQVIDPVQVLRAQADLDARRRPGDPPVAVDRIGRAAGAEQVVWVRITEARLRRQPGMYQPYYVATYVVLDVQARARLFPAPEFPGADPPPPRQFGGELQRRLDDQVEPSQESALLTRMAEIIGRDIARQVYAYVAREIGAPFTD